MVNYPPFKYPDLNYPALASRHWNCCCFTLLDERSLSAPYDSLFNAQELQPSSYTLLPSTLRSSQGI